MTTALPAGWEADVLSALGDPVGQPNLANLDLWQATEGGSTDNPDAFNPFNTTLGEPGSVPTNSAGVQDFPTWAEGLDATVRTIEQPNMTPIAAALAQDAPQAQFEAAVNSTPWGTHFSGAPAQAVTTSVLGDVTGGILGSAFSGFASSLYGIAMKATVVVAGVGLAVAGAIAWTKSTETGQDLEHEAGSALPLALAAA